MCPSSGTARPPPGTRSERRAPSVGWAGAGGPRPEPSPADPFRRWAPLVGSTDRRAPSLGIRRAPRTDERPRPVEDRTGAWVVLERATTRSAVLAEVVVVQRDGDTAAAAEHVRRGVPVVVARQGVRRGARLLGRLH